MKNPDLSADTYGKRKVETTMSEIYKAASAFLEMVSSDSTTGRNLKERRYCDLDFRVGRKPAGRYTDSSA